MSDRLERAIQILVLLQSRLPYNAMQLAQELSVHRRTIFRDIAALRTVGIPILIDPETGCYSLVHSSPVFLESVSNEELTELLIAACLSSLNTGKSAAVARRALLKLLRRLPKSHRDQVARVSRAAANKESTGAAGHDAAESLLVSVRERRIIELTVDDPRGVGLRTFRFQPVKLTFTPTGWSVFGWMLPERRTAELDLSLIREARVTDAEFDESRIESRTDRLHPDFRFLRSPTDTRS